MPLDEQPRLLDVPRLPQRTSELREAHLDLGVTADALFAALAEDLAHEIGGAACDPDQSVVGDATWPRPRDRGLEQVPEAVQLVAPLEVGPARPAPVARTACSGSRRPPALPPRGPRCGGTAPRALVAAAPADLPGHGLEVLVHLGVRELATVTALGQPTGCREVEVAEPSLALEPALDVCERGGAVHLLAVMPEPAGDRHLVEAERAQAPELGATGTRCVVVVVRSGSCSSL